MAWKMQKHRTSSSRRNTPLQKGGLIAGWTLADIHRAIPSTLDFFKSDLYSKTVDLDVGETPLPFGWKRYLDLKTGRIYYKKEKFATAAAIAATAAAERMSRNGKNPKLDLELNLSMPRANPQTLKSPDGSMSMWSLSPISPPSSCVSSELNMGMVETDQGLTPNSPEAKSMILLGCQSCLLYVMVSEEKPKCPNCKSTALLDFLSSNNNNKMMKN